MPSTRNIQLLKETKEKVGKSTAMFFVDYQGLTHKQLEEMRLLLSESNSELSIVKNTLMSLALSEKKLEAKEQLKGPMATLFCYSDDPLAAAKVLYSFLKKHLSTGIQASSKVKFGIFENRLIEEADVFQLATLPSKEILLGKLVGLMKSPISNLVYSLNWNIQRLVLVLKAVEGKKA